MAQKRKNTNRRWAYWLLIVILFVAAAVVCYFVWDTYFKTKGESEVSDTIETEEIVKTAKNDEGDSEEIREDEIVVRDKVKQMEGEDPNEAEGLSGVVTYAEVVGEKLEIGVNIDQFLMEGSCRLEMVQDGGVVYNDAVDIISMVSTSTCDGFDVPLDGLDGGEYGIVIYLESGGKNGIIRGEADI